MLAFLKRFARVVLRIIGFLLLAIFIWYAGPYFAFADYRPLEPARTRLILIGVVIGLWLLAALIRRLRAFRASDMIAAAVMRPAASEAAQTPAEVVKLRERFEEAVATLKKQQRSGNNLYELPWYVIIGAPGSGKTTALINSGLKFPLEARMGRGALKGVGGTRNCDWWFTDEAVFLDTAGRYTTQDSDASSDATGWTEFLALLKKYRKRRPVNGVILTISASDLMTQSDAAREAYVDAARRRLVELNRELNIQLPVYLMVTKTDLVAGFSEYFDDLTVEGRAQVWGVTFPLEQSISGEGAQSFGAEFDALIERLNHRVFARVDEDRDVQRRTRVFGFPQQLGALREALTAFVSDVFAATSFDQTILLRGVYFTSGTQEGTPIDRLLGSMGRGFGVTADLVAPTGRGKAYFVERLLREVMIGESGLAGLNTRLEMKKAALQLGAYAAGAILAALAVVALLVSYNRNSDYLGLVAADVEKLQQAPSVRDNAPPDRILARLDAVRSVVLSADRHRDDVPWGMSWGLYQGSSIGNAARDAYVRELDGLLIPTVMRRLRERIVAYQSAPEKLAIYLKAYLMLGDPKRLDREYVAQLVDIEWGGGEDANTQPATLATHFRQLLEFRDTLRPVPTDPQLVAQSRAVINKTSVPRLVYTQLQSKYANDRRAVRLDVATGAEQLLRRRSGTNLSEPLPAMYSKAVFKEITGLDSIALVKQFAEDDWVWGDSGIAAGNAATLAGNVFDLYERDYIANWNAVLTDLELAPFGSASETARALEILAGPASPLRGLIAVITENSTLYVPLDKQLADAGAVSTGKKIGDSVSKLLKPLSKATGLEMPTPGAIVTAHFQGVHRLTEGEAGKTAIDRLLASINMIQLQLRELVARMGTSDSRTMLSSPELRQSIQLFRQESSGLPDVIRAIVAPIERAAETSVAATATAGVLPMYRDDVLRQCRAVISGRYPFQANSSTDVPLADFGRLFGHDGVFDTFFRANLEPLVDRSQRPWRWRENPGNLSNEMLRTFERVEQIRELFFNEGSQVPGARLSVTITGSDPAVQRVTIDFEGQFLDSRVDTSARTVLWPGPKPSFITMTMAQRFGDNRSAEFRGPWAFFRFFDAGVAEQVNAERNILTVKAGNLQSQLMIEAFKVANPFATREWRQFTCEP
jgi:type VI secretion system protein ImpL